MPSEPKPKVEGESTPPQGEPSEEGEEKPPAQEGQKWWETRGFRNEQEAVAALDKGQKTITDLQEQRSNQERIIGGLMTNPTPGAAPATPGATPPAPTPPGGPGYRQYADGLDFVKAFEDPQKYAEMILQANERMVRDVTEKVVVGYSQAAEIRRQFYKDNADLEQFEEIVKITSNEVYTQHPSMKMKDGMVEIARRARAKIAAIRKGNGGPPAPDPSNPGNQLPHTGAGSSEGLAKGNEDEPKKPTVPVTQADEVAAAIKERADTRQKKLGAAKGG